MTLLELFQLYPTLPPEEQLKVNYLLNSQQRAAMKQYLALAGAAEQTKAQEEEKAAAEREQRRQEQLSNPIYQVGQLGAGALATGAGMGLGQALAGGPGAAAPEIAKDVIGQQAAQQATQQAVQQGAAQGATAAASPTAAGGVPIGPWSPDYAAGMPADAYGSAITGNPGAAQAVESPGMMSAIWGSGGSTTPGSGALGMTGASPLLGAAGIAAGGYTGLQQFKGIANALSGDKLNTQQQVALALPTFGASLLANKFLGNGDKWKTEGNKLNHLNNKGTYLPDNWETLIPSGGRSFDEMQRNDLAADYIGRDSKGDWVNNKFNQSRDVKDLRPEDIVNYSTFAEHDADWFKKPLSERLGLAGDVLNQGLVSEGKGSVDVNWDKYAPVAAAAAPAASGTPAKGTRLSPGVYADGKGGVIYSNKGLMGL